MNQTNHQHRQHRQNHQRRQNQNCQKNHSQAFQSTTNLQTWTMKKKMPKIMTTILEMTAKILEMTAKIMEMTAKIVLAPEAYLLRTLELLSPPPFHHQILECPRRRYCRRLISSRLRPAPSIRSLRLSLLRS